MKDAVIYIAMSVGGVLAPQLAERKLQACRAKATALGLSVTEELVDWEVDEDPSRSRRKRILRSLGTPRAPACVVIYATSDLGAAPRKQQRVRDQIEAAGVELVTALDEERPADPGAGADGSDGEHPPTESGPPGTDTTPLRAVIYVRVSTAEQAKRDGAPEGYSIPAQRESCLRKAEELGASVVEIFADLGASAKTADRDGLQNMLRLIERGGIRYLIVHKIDRLARNRYDDVMIELILRKNGVRLVSVTENIDDTATGMFLHGILSSMAEFYSANLKNEVAKGTLEKLKQGGTPHLAPPGYMNVRKFTEGREGRTIEVDPEQGPLWTWMFEAYATGEYSLRQLLEAATAMGLANRATANRPVRPIHLSKVAKLLQSKYYVGIVTYKNVEYQGKHQHLTDVETWNKVQEVIRGHDYAAEHRRINHHYLKGSLFCARCESRLSMGNFQGKTGVYPYFYCLRRMAGKGCDLPYLHVDNIDARVVEHYAVIQLEPERVEDVRRRILGELDEERRQHARETRRQRSRLERLKGERMKLMQAHYAGAVPIDVLKAEQDRISKGIEQATRVLARKDQQFVEDRDTATKAVDLAANCQAAYRLAGDGVRRQFNQALFQRIFVDVGSVVRSELRPEFARVLAYDVARRFEREAPELITSVVGSNNEPLVGEGGLEPP